MFFVLLRPVKVLKQINYYYYQQTAFDMIKGILGPGGHFQSKVIGMLVVFFRV